MQHGTSKRSFHVGTNTITQAAFVALNGVADYRSLFCRSALLLSQQSDPRVIIDLGFGRGETTLALAQANPNACVLGIEVHKPGVAVAIQRLEAARLDTTTTHCSSNVKLVYADCIVVLADCVPDSTVSEVCVFFPDPFPDSPERRLIRPLLLDLLAQKLKPAGQLHIATDVDSYAAHVQTVMQR
jgi:tRNA (guanine-N7-)-methyltransferase